MHFAKSTFPSGRLALILKVFVNPSKCFLKLPFFFLCLIKIRVLDCLMQTDKSVYANFIVKTIPNFNLFNSQ